MRKATGRYRIYSSLVFVKQIYSPPRRCPWDLFRSFKVCSDAKERERGAESNGKLPHLFIPGKTAALVPEFVAEDLPSSELQPWFFSFALEDVPLGRTVTLVPEFAVEVLPSTELHPWFLRFLCKNILII